MKKHVVFLLLSLLLAIPATAKAEHPAGRRSNDTYCAWREDRLSIPFVRYDAWPLVSRVTVCARVKVHEEGARLLTSDPVVTFRAYGPLGLLFDSTGCTGWAREAERKVFVHGECGVINVLFAKLTFFQDFVVSPDGEMDVVQPAFYRAGSASY